MDNIEQLQVNVNEIKDSLNKLKNNLSLTDIERREEAQKLKEQSDMIKQQIQNEINLLVDKTDSESKKKKERAEALLSSFCEITTLYTSILSTPQNTTVSISYPSTATTAFSQPSDKDTFLEALWEIKDWVWDQWDNIWDNRKWDSEWWKNLLRTVWFAATWVWAMALVYKWAKKLWNWAFWKKEKENTKKEDVDKEDTDNQKEKTDSKEVDNKSFRNTWYWKALKWIWITGGVWWWTYFLELLSL